MGWIEMDSCVLEILKGDNYYCFRYTTLRMIDLFDCLVRFAANPELNLTQDDAFAIIQSICENQQCPE